MDENLKLEATKIFEEIKRMSMPRICITPMLYIEDKDWKKLIYILLEIKSKIEPQIGSPLIIVANDFFGQIKTIDFP
jgi:hypothetical protein